MVLRKSRTQTVARLGRTPSISRIIASRIPHLVAAPLLGQTQ